MINEIKRSNKRFILGISYRERIKIIVKPDKLSDSQFREAEAGNCSATNSAKSKYSACPARNVTEASERSPKRRSVSSAPETSTAPIERKQKTCPRAVPRVATIQQSPRLEAFQRETRVKSLRGTMKSMEGAVWPRFDLVDGLQQFISESQKIRVKNEAVNVAAALIKIRVTQIEQKLGRWSYKIISRSSVTAINNILSNNRHRDPSLTFLREKRIYEKHR